MAEQKKKKIASIDDFFADLRTKNVQELNKAFTEYDEFTKQETQENLFNNIFNPAHDAMYQAITKQLDETFKGDDETKVHNKKTELKKAATAGMKKYFEKAQPSILKAIHGMDDDEQYEVLAHHYDQSVGAGQRGGGASIKDLVEEHAKNKRSTVGTIKHMLYQQKSKQSAYAVNKLKGHVIQHHFSKYHPAEISAHLLPKLEKEGITVEDKIKAATLELGELIGLYEGHKKGEIEGGYERYGFKRKKDEKKDGEDK